MCLCFDRVFHHSTGISLWLSSFRSRNMLLVLFSLAFPVIATPIADETARIVFTTLAITLPHPEQAGVLAIAADKVPIKAHFGVR
jgi:hypothetical protein